LTKGLLPALSLAAPLAGAEPQYPPNFEPVVIYRDMDYINKQSSAPAIAPGSEQVAAAESGKYPPEFEPKVLFRDETLIAEHAQKKPAPTAVEEARPVTAPSAPEAKIAPTESGNALKENFPFVLAVVALVGLAIWGSKRSGAKAAGAQLPQGVTPGAGPTGETGVARYIKDLAAKAVAGETGVARYIKALSAASAKPETEAAEQGATKETGVSRYLRNVT
jgi:hypothetical protein